MCINPHRQSGMTLIEQIMFIVIVSVGVIGLVSVMGTSIRASADPMVSKQFIAIAESLLTEIEHQPFTWCDPGDANASTAQAYVASPGVVGCALYAQNISSPVPAGETRDGIPNGLFYNNVRDYGIYATDNVADPADGNVISGYHAEVAIVETGTSFSLPSDAAVAITVTVCQAPASSCAGQPSFALTGYRFRYAPRY